MALSLLVLVFIVAVAIVVVVNLGGAATPLGEPSNFEIFSMKSVQG